ncbi:hypothetical protein Bca52824_067788 [Brassica carinata]|uniref:Reverse transcriptase zinc-binding domain-containing protein n=1 Tax=Brassica carinata TaxID=52824 RepID=A0A8X7QN50_BRACI|nr:hypothetical protein Bca52824_067788 [Brassica carinata]
MILKIKTSAAPSSDSLFWLPEKSGNYSVKSGYGIGITERRTRETEDDPVNWLKHIWNLKTAPKLKDFLWRMVRKAIPVSANLERRGVASFKCKSCDGVEDDLHVFLNCPLAVEKSLLSRETETKKCSKYLLPSSYVSGECNSALKQQCHIFEFYSKYVG